MVRVAAARDRAGYDRIVQNPGPDQRRTTPVRIDADRAAGSVRITWADDHETPFDTRLLRWLCPCAYCRGEAGMPGWLDSNPSLTAEQTRLVDLAVVGQYALQPTWGDGHATGYYTYLLLRDQCPCPECARTRAQRHAGHEAAPAAPAPDHHWNGGDR